MATLTGTKIANTYKQLLQVGSSNTGLTGTVQAVQDGQGNNSPLQLSQNAVNINGTFQLSGVTLTANASTLNAVADLTGATGIVAVSAGNVYGRTITGGTGVSVTNGDGTEGNPTIALNTTGVTSASYGPATNIEVNAVGQIVSAGAATSVNVSGVTANTFTGGTFAGTTGDFSSNVSVGGNLVIAGEFSPASLSVTGTINANKISATDATFNNVVSAGFFVGDGSGLVNVPSAEGGTMKFITAGTGINFTVDGLASATIPVSGTLNLNTNQSFGIVSATNIDTDELLIAGVSAATVTEVAAVSALTSINLAAITSINTVTDTINSNVSTVSIQTSVNAAAITSINTILGDGSNFATSAELAATSLALATSIDNSNTNITTNTNAITSINTVVANVSALTSVNAAAITSINTILESDVSADSGTFNTLTVVTSASVGGTLNVGGDVGIGTASPSRPLHISASDCRIRLTDSDADTISVELHNSSGSGILSTNGASSLLFQTNNAERLRIDSSGNVGIGISSPATKFHVLDGSSSLRFRQNGTVAETLTVGPSGGDAAIYLGDVADTVRAGLFYDTSENDLQIRGYNNSTRIIIDSTGNIGIGTTSPTYLLDLYKSASTVARIRNTAATGGTPSTTHGEFVIESTDGNMGMQFLGSTTANQRILFGDTDSGGSGQIVYDHTSNYMALSTNGGERLRIDSAGHVAVGTTTTGTTSFTIATSSSGVTPNTTGDDLLIESSGNTGMTIASGTTSLGRIYFGDSDSAIAGRISYDHNDNSLFFGTNGAAEKMTIDSSGNVGIGTASPAKQLHITNAAKADIGTLTDSATITPDFDANQNFSVTLGGNRTLANPSNIDAGQTGSIFVVQDGTGSRTLSFGSYWKFAGGTAPTLSTAAGSVDRIDYIVYTATAIHAVATLNVS